MESEFTAKEKNSSLGQSEINLCKPSEETIPKIELKTSLFQAIEKGNLKLTQKLIKDGADIYAKNEIGQSAFDIASDNKIKNYLEDLLQREKNINTFLSTKIVELESQLPDDAQNLKHLLCISLINQKIIEDRAKSAIKMLLEEKYTLLNRIKSNETNFSDITSNQTQSFVGLKSQIPIEQRELIEGDKETRTAIKQSDGTEKEIKENTKEEIVMIKNDNGQMIVKSATVQKLIERLLDPLVYDNHFTQTLLLNHKVICESHQLLDCITTNFSLNTKESLPQLLKSINIMKYWIEQFWDDFQFDEQLMTKLSNAIAIIENQKFATTLRNMLAKKTASLNESAISMDSTDLPKPVLPKHLLQKKIASGSQKGIDTIGRDPNASFTSAGTPNTSSFNATVSFSGSLSSNHEEGGKLRFADIDPLEAARQLTLIEYELFCKVKLREFTGLAWMKEDKEVRAPNITKMVRWSNHVIKWLVTEIVSIKDSLKNRTAMMEKIVMMAKHCDSLNNFNAVKEIMAALQSSSVGRLRKTREAMSAKHIKVMEDLMALTSNEMNFKNLRTKIHSVEPPMIPFPGVYQGDLVFLESYGKDIQDGMVNFMKFQKVTTYVIELQTYQQAAFKLLPVPGIQDVIKEYLGLEEEPSYALSLICEPRMS